MIKKVSMGDISLMLYLIDVKRAIIPIHELGPAEKIVYFKHGLSPALFPLCQTDDNGEVWKDFDALEAHARKEYKKLSAVNSAATPNRNKRTS